MKEILVKSFLGQTFVYETEVNAEGQTLWDNRIEAEFSSWINTLYQDLPNLFTVQFQIATSDEQILTLLQNLLAKDENDLINSLVSIYFKEVENKLPVIQLPPNKEISKIVLMNPTLIREVTALATLVNLPPAEVISHALRQMLNLANSSDELMRQFWSTALLKNQLVLRPNP